jgi:hypothetical protein
MTESRTYVTEDLWFPCDTCGKQITHHTMHDCFVMNPDILPTLEEWKLICKMVKQQCELTDEEIEHIAQQHLTVHVQFIGAGDCTIEGEIEFARAVLKKAREK